jgi:hypothetical protein
MVKNLPVFVTFEKEMVVFRQIDPLQLETAIRGI